MHQEYKSFETERLLIQPTTELDASFILELINTPKWVEYMGDYKVYTHNDVLKYIHDGITIPLNKYGYSDFTVIRKSDGVKLGTCGLYHREGIGGVDLGFAFLPQYEKQGYAFESASKLKEIAFEHFKLDKINSITTASNDSAQKLMRKLGFSYLNRINIPQNHREYLLYQLE